MKNLKTLITAGIISIFASNPIKAQETKFKSQKKLLKNGLQISAGIKTWLNPSTHEYYGPAPVFRLNQEIKTPMDINIGASMELAKKQKEKESMYKAVELFQASIGMKKYFFPSNSENFSAYLKTGIGNAIGYKKISKLRSIRSTGYYLGGGLEINSRSINWNFELNYNGIIKEKMNNLEIAAGLKFYF